MICSCKDSKFCKRCYSKCYYELNKEKILAYQKDRYRRNKDSNSGIVIVKKDIILTFD